MKIRTRAFLLGLLPTLLVALVLTAYHVHSRLGELESSAMQQGMALARHLASSAEYGVVSGNTETLGKLLDQALADPGVVGVLVVWPDRTRLARGETPRPLPLLGSASQWQSGMRNWYIHPVTLNALDVSDPFLETSVDTSRPLAWVAVGFDARRKQALAQQLLLASAGITLLGMTLAILLIHTLALTAVRPLLDIIAAVKRISSGGFGTRMDVTARAPELRGLQFMVNQMSESLRAYQQEMESKVHAVTAELESKKKEAEQANLAKSKFLAAASHDLRQPMHAISLYVESLKPQMHGRVAEDTLNKIERSILGMVDLFNAILDVTRLDAGVIQPKLVPVRLRKLLLHLAEEFAAEADSKGLSLRVRAPDVWIASDEILLERVLRNLLTNALHHTVRGGVLLSARLWQGDVRLQIWDTGCGIAAELQPRIFEEFYQVEAAESHAHQGLGLGLAIVRRLARLLHLPLQLHSRPGLGTVFTLDVPLHQNEPPSADAEDRDDNFELTGCALVVDDDPDALDALGNLLRQWGMEVRAASSLQPALDAQQPVPDVVFADYQLRNGETGLMVARAVRERWGARLPVVLITGDTRTETIQTLRQNGLPMLHKPVRPHQLRRLLARLLQARRAEVAAANAARPENGV